MKAHVSYSIRRLLNHLPIQVGARSDRRLRTTGMKRARFASFMEMDGFRTHNVDRYERSLRRRRTAKWMLLSALGFFGAWVALESARALTIL